MSQVELFERERATNYNQFVEAWIPNYQYFLDRLPNLLREATSKNLLVVGCGTGNEINRFTQASEHWDITGIDPSPDMLNQAHEKLHAYQNVTLVEGLVSDLDPAQKYGAATLLLVLHFLDDQGNKLSLLKDIAERLEPGALLVMLDITGDKKQIKQNLAILRLLLPNDLDDDQVTNRLNRIENELYPVSETRLADLCLEAGFESPLRFFQSAIYMGWLTRKN
ncbi:class I SAM-dependent methyltransferase [Spirosoma foliorum]|uniref:Class I SAM-dependent methyltransferase n=1 Tax=Spirosoma foliorum TaxID=2710596 RepID=A0A7G5H0J0_9BACT|nr:class I SAM-dependent methyltransferase [Spirosoma foliorum]QMW04632.1 class I SAM-dependent methyltransferase [Spirosoma foliorum]